MTGYLHYFLSMFSPTSTVGFFRAFADLMTSPAPAWWLYVIGPFVVVTLPTLVLWAVYLVRPAAVRPPLPDHPLKAEPLVSVVIAGRNESATIAQSIRGALLCGYSNLEVIFVDDHSEDASVSVARRAALGVMQGAWDSNRVRIFPSPRRNGKASSLNIGIRMARGEFIIINDADSMIQYGSLPHWLLPFEDPRVGAVAANIRVANGKASLLTRLQEIEYALKATSKAAQARLDILTIVSGMGGIFRAEILHRLGGIDTGLGDDRDLTMMIRKQRWKVAYSFDAVVWTTVPVTRKHLWSQRSRWRRNVVKICLSKHRDYFIVGRYGFANTVAYMILFNQIVLPLAAIVVAIGSTIEFGPWAVPEILVVSYWISIFYYLLKMLVARDFTRVPANEDFVLVFLLPFYFIYLVSLAQYEAFLTELFRIGTKHPYVPDHIWEEIPWW